MTRLISMTPAAAACESKSAAPLRSKVQKKNVASYNDVVTWYPADYHQTIHRWRRVISQKAQLLHGPVHQKTENLQASPLTNSKRIYQTSTINKSAPNSTSTSMISSQKMKKIHLWAAHLLHQANLSWSAAAMVDEQQRRGQLWTCGGVSIGPQTPRGRDGTSVNVGVAF
jgi:hypothetical protein